ncbi:MAG: hypothetical protein C0516_15385 [Gemmatimonas sp.]|nr:hypothetical protein [Gemmatimonas sp.]
MSHTMHQPLPPSADDCARFDATLGAWLEGDTDAATTAWMAAHRASCPMCSAVVTDLEQLVADAAALPSGMTLSRDVWPEIEARLEAQVIPISRGQSGSAQVAPAAQLAPTQRASAQLASAQLASAPSVSSPRAFSRRALAIAATLLVAVSSGVTWQLTRPARPLVDQSDVAIRPDAQPSTQVPSTVLPPDANSNRDTPDSAASATAPSRRAVGSTSNVRLVADDALPDLDATYEREIGALRQIVDERFAELDTATVRELRRNLDIIDKAIGDSKAALARDPRSPLLSGQLDRALEAKLQLLRRVALL